MPTFQAPRGTRDLLPADRAAMLRLERIGTDLARRYGYQPIDTPLFEDAAVFERGVGSVTDVVEKELFRVVPSRGADDGAQWALRPEPTAGIARAYVQHGMQTWPQPVKVTLTGPMFRYDRPQAGRYRQFWQFDVEAIGDGGPAIDAEVIALALHFYREVGLDGVAVHLNSIGDPACRPAYIEKLRSYFADHLDRLPPVERQRLETNPLRLLDSKEPVMRPLIAVAPQIAEDLCDPCREHWEGTLAHLRALSIEPLIQPTLVRGLDYYTRTTFEFFRVGSEGSQDAVGGGGRYDGLVELMGGRPTPGIGFGLGLDRIALALTGGGQDATSTTGTVVVGADPDDTAARLRIAALLREAGLTARAELARRKLGKQLEGASRDGAHFAVIVGDELTAGQVQLKDLDAGTQRQVNLDDLVREIERASAQHRHGTAAQRRESGAHAER
jgi:histidyl-tRNA synthetase